MKEIRNEKLRNQFKVLIEIINHASPEERIKLADKIRIKKEKMESKAGKDLWEILNAMREMGLSKLIYNKSLPRRQPK